MKSDKGANTLLIAIICVLLLRLDKIILAVAKAYLIIKKANHDFTHD